MSVLKVIPYPYYWQNAKAEDPDQLFKSYIGKSKGECIDPQKTTKIIANASFLSKKF
ncbi:MAG: hypothetical protein HWD61_03445 [Parachlamydiaceae bacterium]|nr:MAG: hypothetical protein HWD61_03445 [Parachlamydiaceae bacterium]